MFLVVAFAFVPEKPEIVEGFTQLECRLHGSKPKKFPLKDRKVPRLRLKANIVVVPPQVPMQGVWKAVPD